MASSSRSQLDSRPISITYEPLEHVDGSATFSFGDEQALASLNGPIEVRIRDELTDRATLEITHIPLDGVAGITSSAFTTSLIKIFTSVLLLAHYPRSLISITLQSINRPPAQRTFPPAFLSALNKPVSTFKRQTIRPNAPHPDASMSVAERASLINAAMGSILSAGVPASATIVAVSIAILPRRIARALRRGGDGRGESSAGDEMDQDDAEDASTILVDPDLMEESYALSRHLFAFACSGHRIDGDNQQQASIDQDEDEDEDDGTEAKLVMVDSSGAVDFATYRASIRLARREAKVILGQIRKSLERKYLASS